MFCSVCTKPRSRSWLDYGSIVCRSARSLCIRQLNTIDHQVPRLILGALLASLVQSLYVAGSKTLLNDRRIKLAMHYVVKLTTNSLNHASNYVFKRHEEPTYEARLNDIQPLRVKPHLWMCRWCQHTKTSTMVVEEAICFTLTHGTEEVWHTSTWIPRTAHKVSRPVWRPPLHMHWWF